MVIGPLFYRRLSNLAFFVVLALILSTVSSTAEDQITKKDGSTITGQVLGVSDGRVMVQSTTSRGGVAKGLYPLTDIKSVDMAVPAAVTAVQAPGTTPAAVVASLEPAVKQFAGLPAIWVVGAMAQLAEAYAAENQPDRALAVYNQILQFYPGSAYETVAKAGMAGMDLKAGKIDEAFNAVQPILERADKDIAPSPIDGAIYASAFLVRGQVYESQKKPQKALEDYLTVKTMFYQNPTLVDQADQLAKSLRDHNPGLGID
jgi:tetratricopeptide (TPR) repeat protein